MSDDSEADDRIAHWASVVDDSTYYEVLGILDIADPAAIKTAFHQFALAFHPDSHLDADAERQAQVRRVFKRGAEAYRVLMDAGMRSKYDLALARGHLRLEQGEIPKTAPIAPGNVKTLADLCKSDAARMSAQRAESYLNASDFNSAKRELKMAIYHDGNKNPELEERLDAIDLALFAMGE